MTQLSLNDVPSSAFYSSASSSSSSLQWFFKFAVVFSLITFSTLLFLGGLRLGLYLFILLFISILALVTIITVVLQHFSDYSLGQWAQWLQACTYEGKRGGGGRAVMARDSRLYLTTISAPPFTTTTTTTTTPPQNYSAFVKSTAGVLLIGSVVVTSCLSTNAGWSIYQVMQSITTW